VTEELLDIMNKLKPKHLLKSREKGKTKVKQLLLKVHAPLTLHSVTEEHLVTTNELQPILETFSWPTDTMASKDHLCKLEKHLAQSHSR
jgi:hypothetical protein